MSREFFVKFKTRQKYIDAIRWDGFNDADVAEFARTDDPLFYVCVTPSYGESLKLFIRFHQDVQLFLDPLEWITRSADGSFRTWTPEEFNKTFEPVEILASCAGCMGSINKEIKDQ